MKDHSEESERVRYGKVITFDRSRNDGTLVSNSTEMRFCLAEPADRQLLQRLLGEPAIDAGAVREYIKPIWVQFEDHSTAESIQAGVRVISLAGAEIVSGDARFGSGVSRVEDWRERDPRQSGTVP